MASHLEHVLCAYEGFWSLLGGCGGRGSHGPESMGLHSGRWAWARQCLPGQLHLGLGREAPPAHLCAATHPWGVHGHPLVPHIPPNCLRMTATTEPRGQVWRVADGRCQRPLSEFPSGAEGQPLEELGLGWQSRDPGLIGSLLGPPSSGQLSVVSPLLMLPVDVATCGRLLLRGQGLGKLLPGLATGPRLVSWS